MSKPRLFQRLFYRTPPQPRVFLGTDKSEPQPLPEFTPSESERAKIVLAQQELVTLVQSLARNLARITCGPFPRWELAEIDAADLPRYHRLISGIMQGMIDIIRGEPLLIWQPASFYRENIPVLEAFQEWTSIFNYDMENSHRDPIIIHLNKIESTLDEIGPKGWEIREHLPKYGPRPPRTDQFIWYLNDLLQQQMAVLVDAASCSELHPCPSVSRQSSSTSTGTLVESYLDEWEQIKGNLPFGQQSVTLDKICMDEICLS
ncbi:hypothetical protein C8J56DRAFT_911482, partial [Mycena floridula]